MILLNDKEVKISKFPNNESCIDIDREHYSTVALNTITFKYEDDAEFFLLRALKEHIGEEGGKCNLFIPYLPYSRMDRKENSRLFTLKSVCKLINELNFEKVIVCEPHSDVSVGLLDRVKVVNISEELLNALIIAFKEEGIIDDLVVVYPDAGACKRYSKIVSGVQVLTANKVRDFNSGKITKIEINGSVDKPFKAVIVDDLCSAGGTFIGIAELLRDMGATYIELIVAHCENTINTEKMLDSGLINIVATSNSILTKEHSKIKSVDVLNLGGV